MARLTGKNLYVSFGGTALSASQRSFDVSQEQETADVTAGADDFRNYANTVKMISATMEIVVDEWASGGSAIRTALALGTEGTLLWGPEGTATGKPKRGFLARIAKLDESIPFDDALVISVEFQMAGTALLFSGGSVW